MGMEIDFELPFSSHLAKSILVMMLMILYIGGEERSGIRIKLDHIWLNVYLSTGNRGSLAVAEPNIVFGSPFLLTAQLLEEAL